MVESVAQATTAVAYAVAALAMLAVVSRQRPAVRRYSYVVVSVVVVSAVGATLQAYGVWSYSGAVEQQQSVPQLVDDCVAYAGLFAVMTYSSGASRGMVLLVTGLSVGSRVAIEIGGFFGGGLLLAGLLASLGSYGARIYLLWGPVWRTAQGQPERQRLLYWKGRNTLMLLIGVNILTGILSAALFTRLVQLVVLEYVNFMLRVGFAGFLLSNVEALAPAEVTESL